jgi:hypothetical protein
MSEPHITLDLQGDQCRITMPPDAWCKVKVYRNGGLVAILAPLVTDEDLRRKKRRRHRWETPTSNSGLVALKLHDRLYLAVYDRDGEANLLKQEYQRDDTGLVPTHGYEAVDGVHIEVVTHE